MIYTISIWVYDKFIFGEYYFYKDGMDKDFDNWYQKTGLVSMVIYFILAIRYYNKYRKLIFQVVSYADRVLFRWIKTYLCSFLIMILLPIVFDIATYFYPKLASYQGSWWFFLLFSVVMYYIAVTGYSNNVVAKIPFRMSALESKPILLLSENQSDHSNESTIDIEYEVFDENPNPEIETWKHEIHFLIQTEKLYQNPELTLTEVAKKLQTNVAVISKNINQGFKIAPLKAINRFKL